MLSSCADDSVTKLCCEGVVADLSSCSRRLPTIEVPSLTVSVQPSTVEVSLPVEVPLPTAVKALVTRSVDREGHRSRCNGSSCLSQGGRQLSWFMIMI
jgi:hypothetical protein